MSKYFKAILLSGVALFFVRSADASGVEDLEARLAALESMVSELKAELAAERASADKDIVRLEQAPSAEASAAGKPTQGSGIKVGGFIDFDAHITSLSDGGFAANSIARDFHIPGATPIGGSETKATDFTAESSRFYISGKREVEGHKLSAHIEMDFLGSAQGDQRVSNSYSPRLRRAYLDVDNLRIGQDWSTFQNTSAIPESASFLALSDGMVFERQPMIRYTRGNFQFALENGSATVTSPGGTRVEADSNLFPDAVVRYNFTGDFGNLSVAGLARQLRYEASLSEEETYGFGLSISGLKKIGEKDDIRFALTGGEGLGRYIGLNAINGAAINPVTGEIEAIPSIGGLIAWRHPFGETARLNIGYSGLFADNPDFMLTSTTKSVQSVYGAVLWDIAPQVTMGTELLFGQRENEAGTDGNITRFTFSTKYAF